MAILHLRYGFGRAAFCFALRRVAVDNASDSCIVIITKARQGAKPRFERRNRMKYISLFSGLEAATVAWKPLGWESVAYSEIDPFPKAVLAHHYPDVPDLGDMTKIDWSEYRGTVDLVVGGSPCQAFSVAGLRKALDDPRGQLMLEYIRACYEVDPEWIVWENVPGVLSADGGRAFGSLLACVAELWPHGGAAWRVLDAQFFGVAQRRRRVFLVINTRDWRRAAPVLFERESLQWDYPSSREARQALAGRSDASTGASTWCAGDSGVNMPFYRDMSPTLTAHDANSACFVNVPSTCIIRSGKDGGGKCALVQRDMSATLTTAQQQTLFTASPDECSVRRLTPIECERLQGFPDGYTDVPWRGAEHAPDSRRYKALGNSMAVPVMRWIGEGIELVNRSM